jgi:hypothetical protein
MTICEHLPHTHFNMTYSNGRLPPTPAKSGKRSSTSTTSESVQVEPEVPPLPSKRLGSKVRASMPETGSLSKRLSARSVRPKAQSGSQAANATTSTSKPSPNSKARELELVNQALRVQVKGLELKVVALTKGADRAALADAALLKLRFEKEQLTIDLASKTQRAQGLDARASEMANRLVQAEKRARSLEGEAADLQKRNNNSVWVNSKLSSSALATPTDTSKLVLENADLREQLELANAAVKTGDAETEYLHELEKANTAINRQYAAVVSQFSIKNWRICELEDQVGEMRAKINELLGKMDTEDMMLRIEYLQSEVVKATRDRDQVEFDALNGLKQFRHLKQKPPQRLSLIVSAGVEVSPVATNVPSLTGGLCSLFPVPTPNASYSVRTCTIPKEVHVTVHIPDPEPKNLTFVQRMHIALSKRSTLTVSGPQHVITQIQDGAAALEAAHAAQRAKTIELRAHLQGQAREIEMLKAKGHQDVRQLKTRHCLLVEHRNLEDHVKAMQERLDMQAILLAMPEPLVEKRDVKYRRIEEDTELGGFGLPVVDDGLGA